MPDEQKIEELQKQIDELAAEMQGYRQKLFVLHQELKRLQNEEVKSGDDIAVADNRQAQKKFRLENFIGLRLIHFVMVVVLVIGLSIGVKYAIDRQLISEEARIILAYLAGGILYFLSRILKRKY